MSRASEAVPREHATYVSRPLLARLPHLASSVHFTALGDFPTPVEAWSNAQLGADADLFIKRDDLSSKHYGGNKVRTLEVLFGLAIARGCEDVIATGAFGSNHALATALHAPRVGLRPFALLCPQPPSPPARENLACTAGRVEGLVAVRHWSLMPWPMLAWSARAPRAMVMAPGGATPHGALGYVSAGLELAEQVRAGSLPAPRRIVLPVGSCCTSAGLLVGLRLARALGIAFEHRMPQVYSVRVTPWPVTSPVRIAYLAWRTARLLARLSGQARFAFGYRELLAGLFVDGSQLGAGYGEPTGAGLQAMERLGAFGATLDTTYSAKAAAALLSIVATQPGPTLFWATKSSARLPEPDVERLGRAPRGVTRWLDQYEAQRPKPSSRR